MEDEGLIPEFLSTPSVGRATRTARTHRQMSADFYPRPPWGGRPCYADDFVLFGKFLSTPSVGRATCTWSFDSRQQIFLSTPSVGRATCYADDFVLFGKFLSTPSVGRATGGQSGGDASPCISIHALRGEGDVRPKGERPMKTISIHALRGEGDRASRRSRPRPPNFYPRPPWGGRPGTARYQLQIRIISIHALRGEGDCRSATGPGAGCYFYPRPPWGGRPRRDARKNNTI